MSEIPTTRAAAASAATSAATVSSSLSTGPVERDNGEIVPRDQNGNYKLDIPVLPPVMLGEDGDEAGAMEGVEEGGAGAGGRSSGGSGSTGVNSGSAAVDAELGGREKESTSMEPGTYSCKRANN